MDQIIILRKGGFAFRIPSKTSGSVITKASQHVEMLGADTVDISVQSAVKLNFIIGDYIEVIGRRYTLNTTPKEKKGSSRDFSYDLQFEGAQYDLLRANYSVNVDTTTSEIQDLSGDSLTGDIKIFLDVLVANLVRVFPSQWVLGSYPLNSETKTLTFSDSDNCLSVLQTICTDYETQFTIVTSGAVNTINIGEVGQIFPYTFEYGKGKGLYDLTNERVSSSNIITRLNVYGSSKNINTSKYRAFKLCLPTKTKGKSYLEDSTAIAKYGIWEDTKTFEEIYPHRTGTVTSVDSTVKFKDSTMDFDLNAKDANGTIHLIAGSGAKVHFNTGNLAGYEFDAIYDHATKAFTIKPFTDENGFTFPSETSAAFQFKLNDEYVILGIYLPQSYIDNAEAELQVKGLEHLAKFSQPNVQYSLNLDPVFLRDKIGSEVESNILWVGDFIPIKDSDLNVDKSIRVKGFTRDLLKDFAYSLTIADQTVSTSIINRIVSDIKGINNVVKINNLNDPARARRNYLNSQEVLDLIFDQEGDFYTEKIKPLSIDTSMLSVGAKYMQFGLVGTIFQPNYAGTKNRVVYTGGALTHYAILNGENPRTWNIASGDIVLSSDAAFYIYAKCLKSGTSGTILFSTTQILVEEDVNNYHFLIGIINSVGANNERAVALMYGFSAMNGRFIKTGRVQSADGQTYFDLDTGEIQGKISFKSGSGGYNNLADKPDLSVFSEKTYVDSLATSLQSQIDGVVDSWFYAYSPTLANYPASEWTTDIIKDRHIGDTFTSTQEFVDNATTPDAGKSWRFGKNGSVYSWGPIADSDAVKALLAASQAQDTADGKRRTFTTQPTNADAYAVGDLWVNATYSTTYSNDILKCKTAKVAGAAFSISHWEKAGRYTDDTAVDNLEIGGRNLILNSLNRIGFKSNNHIVFPIQDQAVSGENYRRFRRTYPAGITSTDIGIHTGEFFTPEKSGYYTYATYFRPNEFDIKLRLRIVDFGTYALCKANEWTQISITAWIEAGVATRLYGAYGIMPPEAVQWIDYNRVSVTSGNKPTDWTPAPEDVQAEIDAYSYLKEAMQNATDIQGGLLSTTLIKLGAVNQSGNWVEKAGINGAGTNDSTPRIYAGGNLQEALNRIANITPAARFVVTEGGKLYAIDVELAGSFSTRPAGGKRIHISDAANAVNIHDDSGNVKTAITSDSIPSLATLLTPNSAEVIATQSISLYKSNGSDARSAYAGYLELPSTATNYKIITPPILCTVGAICGNEHGGITGADATVSAKLEGNGISIALGSLSISNNTANTNNSNSATFPAQIFESMPSGTYRILLYATVSSGLNDTASCTIAISAPNNKLTGLSVVEVSRITRNGLFLINDASNYMYLNPYGVVERSVIAPNRPGVLASGSVDTAGSSSNKWGPKVGNSVKSSTGVFRVSHSIGHSRYSVGVTPRTSVKLFYISAKTTTYFDVTFTNTAGTAINADFDYNITGENF